MEPCCTLGGHISYSLRPPFLERAESRARPRSLHTWVRRNLVAPLVAALLALHVHHFFSSVLIAEPSLVSFQTVRRPPVAPLVPTPILLTTPLPGVLEYSSAFFVLSTLHAVNDGMALHLGGNTSSCGRSPFPPWRSRPALGQIVPSLTS